MEINKYLLRGEWQGFGSWTSIQQIPTIYRQEH
jgi:hypothetical protein